MVIAERACACGRPISKRATSCRWCRPYAVKPLAERFVANYVKDASGCWLWRGASDGTYGKIREGGAGTRQLLAHRVSYELFNGPIPDGMLVCHTCDNPPCVHPAHLFLGTYADNNADRDAKGRTVTGDRWYKNRPSSFIRYGGAPRTRANGRPTRAKSDPVTAGVRWAVMRRDGACILSRLDPTHVCRDRWGNEHPADSVSRLTVEHVKSELRMGQRAPSDLGHLVAMCYAGNVGVPTKVQREAIREYLRGVPQ